MRLCVVGLFLLVTLCIGLSEAASTTGKRPSKKSAAVHKAARSVAGTTAKVFTGVDPTAIKRAPAARHTQRSSNTDRVDRLVREYNDRNKMVKAGLKDLRDAAIEGTKASWHSTTGNKRKTGVHTAKSLHKTNQATKRAEEHHRKYSR
mmetsp:Transcript_9114/g.28266  ORF Transcript_9114/g.28266 Transcript_9114/m.28266 type:complete len:148 (+) Transcript_9114:818-1261(+)